MTGHCLALSTNGLGEECDAVVSLRKDDAEATWMNGHDFLAWSKAISIVSV